MKTASRNRRVLFPVLLAAMLPLAAQATEPSKGTIETEISAELASGTPAQVQGDPGVIEAYLGSMDDVSSLRRENHKVAT